MYELLCDSFGLNGNIVWMLNIFYFNSSEWYETLLFVKLAKKTKKKHKQN